MFKKASNIEPRPVEYLWQEHIPIGMISIIAGAPEKGKSTIAMRVAADVSKNDHVIISTHEDPFEETAVPRLIASNAVLDNVDLCRLRFPRDFVKLKRKIVEKNTALVLIDPISSHTSASIYHPTNIRASIEPIMDMSDELDCSFVFVTHTIKKVDLSTDPLNAIGGSAGGLAAVARACYLLGLSPEDEDERILAHLKCNVDSKRPSLRFMMDIEQFENSAAGYAVLLGRSSFGAEKVFNAKPRESGEKSHDVAEWLIENLREGPMDKSKILEGARDRAFSKKITIRVAEQLELVMGNKWQLPKGFPDAV